jgi:hypothetical protein
VVIGNSSVLAVVRCRYHYPASWQLLYRGGPKLPGELAEAILETCERILALIADTTAHPSASAIVVTNGLQVCIAVAAKTRVWSIVEPALGDRKHRWIAVDAVDEAVLLVDAP